MMRTVGVVAIAICLYAPSLAVPQVAVPPPPRPADAGPTLEATMQYIQQKLNSVGKISYVAPWHNLTDGSDNTNTFTYELSNVSADAGSCQVNFHEKATRDGAVVEDGNFAVLLKVARDVIVEPMDQKINKWNAEAGHPNMVEGATTPPVLAFTVRKQNAGETYFVFTDLDMVDRTAKAFTHAIELCGGGSKELF